MMADGKPEHWPAMVPNVDASTEQDAIRVLASVRRIVVSYYQSLEYEDWRLAHAQSAHMVNVINGLIADMVATDQNWRATEDSANPLRERVKELQEQLVESKRPFSAQMEMQNRRIIALTAELDGLKEPKP